MNFADSIIVNGTYVRKRIHAVINRFYRQRLYFEKVAQDTNLVGHQVRWLPCDMTAI